MNNRTYIFIILILLSTATYSDTVSPIVYSGSNFDEWYYKKTKAYQGWKYIVIHHSATRSGSVNAFHKFHTKQGYGGIAYHFVIGNGNGMDDGEVKQTFRWDQQISGTHVTINSWHHNVFGIGICLVGNLENQPPTPAQMKALKYLVAKLKRQYSINHKNVIGHKHVQYDHMPEEKEKTACPGKKMDMNKLRS